MRLGDVCNKITDGSHNPPAGINCSDYIMLSSKNIHDDLITYDDPRYLSEEDFVSENTRTQIVPGDLLLTIVGTVGRAAVVPENSHNICLQRSVAVIKPNTDIIIPRFLMYQLQSMRSFLEQEAKGVAQKGIYLKQVENLPITIFDYDTQEYIVKKLDKLTAIISLRKQQLAKLDELVKARFVEMFGDPISNPLGWETDDMKGVCTKITDGEHGSVARVDSGNVFLNAKHVKKDGTIDWKTVTYTTDEVHSKIYARCNPEPGDILLTTTGTIGNVAIVPDVTPFSMDRGITLLKLRRDKVNSTFVAALLNFEDIQEVMNSNVHASAIGHLFLNKVMRIPVVVPPIELQNQFATFVKQTDKSKSAIQQSLDKLETLKKALMQKYFG